MASNAELGEAIERPNYSGPRTLEEILEYLKENPEKAVLANADVQPVFVAWHPTEEMWRSDSVDPESGNRATSFTHENTVTRWLEEALSGDTGQVWPVDRTDTPLEEADSG